MVDFQSRDTRRRRSVSDESGDERPAGEEAAAEEAVAEESTDKVGTADSDRPVADDGEFSAAVVTVSASRGHDDDPGGEAVVAALEAAGNAVVTREVLRPGHDSVQQTVDTLAARGDVDAVVTNGATGVGRDDVTIEAVHPLVDKGLPGFGELFRRRYAEQVGTDAVGTRATAGICGNTPVFCLPGDPDAARLGTAEIVVEQAARLADAAAADR